MATYSNSFRAGETDTNVFDTSLLSGLLRAAPEGAQLATGGTAMTYVFDLASSFSFTAATPLTAAWTGTITGISTIFDDTQVSIGTGFNASATAVRDAIAAGDTDMLNWLFWSGNDVLTGSKSNDTLRGFSGADEIYGGSGNDTLIGDYGNDRLSGGYGDDNLFGGYGNDRLFGKAGNDALAGGSGRDVLIGGSGSDTLSGGAGADAFWFRTLGDIKGNDIDRITDFSHAEGDKIDVSRIDANSSLTGDQAFTFIDNTGDTLTGTPAAGSLVLETGKGDGDYLASLYVDDTGAHLSFLVHSASGALTAADFIL